MIRLANNEDITTIANMMKLMYLELFGELASTDTEVYANVVKDHIANERDYIYVDDKFRGFFVVRDETEPMTPTLHRWNGIRVFIHERYRRSPLLSLFYSHLFKNHPDGDILGVTEINSDHIQVMDKRHKLIAKTYILNRS